MNGNLLPWRQQEYLHHCIALVILTIVLQFIILICLISCHQLFFKKILQQRQSNNWLQSKCRQITINHYLQQKQQYQHALVIANLIKNNRRQNVIFLTAWQILSKALTTGIQISQLQFNHQCFQITGKAMNSHLVLSLLSALQQNQHIDHLVLKHMHQENLTSATTKHQVTLFILQLHVMV
jgi:hypothetical protein